MSADWTQQFGYLVPVLSQLTKGTALPDAEVCAVDAGGRSDFKTCLDGHTPIVFFAFDLLEQDGEDIAKLPQIERKASGREVFDAMCADGFEGVVSKSATVR